MLIRLKCLKRHWFDLRNKLREALGDKASLICMQIQIKK